MAATDRIDRETATIRARLASGADSTATAAVLDERLQLLATDRERAIANPNHDPFARILAPSDEEF